MWADFDSKQDIVIINGVNQSSIALSKNAEYHTRIRHIKVKYHFIRWAVINKLAKTKFEWVNTEDVPRLP